MTIDCGAIRATRMRHDPFAWAPVPGVVDKNAAGGLVDTFPEDGFLESARAASDKSYQLASRQVLPRGFDVDDDPLPEPWPQLIEALRSDEYRRGMEELSGLSLADKRLELSLWRFGPGCWLSPHRDKPAKILTHVLYFNVDWERSWGGCLQILRSENASDVAAEVVPVPGESVVVVRSESSWHAVSRVRTEIAGARVRRSLTAIFYANDDED